MITVVVFAGRARQERWRGEAIKGVSVAVFGDVVLLQIREIMAAAVNSAAACLAFAADRGCFQCQTGTWMC